MTHLCARIGIQQYLNQNLMTVEVLFAYDAGKSIKSDATTPKHE